MKKGETREQKRIEDSGLLFLTADNFSQKQRIQPRVVNSRIALIYAYFLLLFLLPFLVLHTCVCKKDSTLQNSKPLNNTYMYVKSSTQA